MRHGNKKFQKGIGTIKEIDQCSHHQHATFSLFPIMCSSGGKDIYVLQVDFYIKVEDFMVYVTKFQEYVNGGKKYQEIMEEIKGMVEDIVLF